MFRAICMHISKDALCYFEIAECTNHIYILCKACMHIVNSYGYRGASHIYCQFANMDKRTFAASVGHDTRKSVSTESTKTCLCWA